MKPVIISSWLTAAHRKAFSLTPTHRNLHIGSSSAAGLLPQAEAPRSPWQPCHSDGQRGVGAGRAAALSHRPPALIAQRGSNHCHHRPVVLIVLPSLGCLFVKERVGVSSSVSWLCLFHLFGRLSITAIPEGLDAWCLRAHVRNPSNISCKMSLSVSVSGEWVCNNRCCISLCVMSLIQHTHMHVEHLIKD